MKYGGVGADDDAGRAELGLRLLNYVEHSVEQTQGQRQPILVG
jgi:hypothetical protein